MAPQRQEPVAMFEGLWVELVFNLGDTIWKGRFGVENIEVRRRADGGLPAELRGLYFSINR